MFIWQWQIILKAIFAYIKFFVILNYLYVTVKNSRERISVTHLQLRAELLCDNKNRLYTAE